MSTESFLVNRGYSNFSKIGEGGFGKIYRALNANGVPVAIKIISLRNEIIRDYTINEYEILRYLKEDDKCREHILCLLDADVVDDRAIIITEFIDGISLHDLIYSNQNIDWIPLFKQLAQVINTIHQLGVVHRDLKPDNIMISKGQVVILDFGLACMVKPIKNVYSCRKYSYVGTPPYIAPEVLSNTVVDFFATDVYSLGVIFYRAVSGGYPYPILPLEEFGEYVKYHRPIPLPDYIPDKLRSLIMRMINQERYKRPTMEQVVKELTNLY